VDCTPSTKIVIAMSGYGNEAFLPMTPIKSGQSFSKQRSGPLSSNGECPPIEKRSSDTLFNLNSRTHCSNLEELRLAAPLLIQGWIRLVAGKTSLTGILQVL